MAKYTYDSGTSKLRLSPNNFSCKEMRKLLEDLGFTVVRTANGNHHTFSHPHLATFFGSSYNCGHKATMLPVYPKNVLKILEEYEDELRALKK